MSTVLDEIIVGVREDLAARVQQVPLEEMKKRALAAAPARDALASLRGEVPGGGNGTTAPRSQHATRQVAQPQFPCSPSSAASTAPSPTSTQSAPP